MFLESQIMISASQGMSQRRDLDSSWEMLKLFVGFSSMHELQEYK